MGFQLPTSTGFSPDFSHQQYDRHLLRFGNQQWWMQPLPPRYCLWREEWYQLWYVALGAAVFVAWFSEENGGRKTAEKLVEHGFLLGLWVGWFERFFSLIRVWLDSKGQPVFQKEIQIVLVGFVEFDALAKREEKQTWKLLLGISAILEVPKVFLPIHFY